MNTLPAHPIQRPEGWLPADPLRSALAGQGAAWRLPADQSVSRRARARLLFRPGPGVGEGRFSRGSSASTSSRSGFRSASPMKSCAGRAPGRGAQLPDWRWNRLRRLRPRRLGQAGARHLHAAASGRRSGWARVYGLFMRAARPARRPAHACPSRRSCSSSFRFAAWPVAAGSTARRCSNCALNYAENFRLFRKGWPDYLIASAFIVGVNSITTAFFYTIPFGAVFGLCLVDTWFGPIYAESVAKDKSPSKAKPEPALAETRT